MRRRTVSLWIALLVVGAVVPVASPAFGVAASSYPGAYVVVGDRAVFVAIDGVHGSELWATDLVDTWMLADIRPGTEGSDIGGLTVAGDQVYFVADDGEHGRELWRTDITPAGTGMVHDLHPGDGAGINSMAPLGSDGSLVFAGDDGGGAGNELWAYDAATDTVSLVADIEAGGASSGPASLAPLDDMVLFSAETGAAGREPYATDGTAVVSLGDLLPAGSSSPHTFTDLGNGRATFTAVGPSGRELYATNGTAAGTTMVADINPGGDSFPGQPHPLGDGRWVFRADDGVNGGELWVTDLTGAGTQLLHSTQPGAASGQPGHFTTLGDRLLFSADGVDGREMWSTDGTPAGLVQVVDLQPGVDGSNPDLLGVAGSYAIVLARVDETGHELYRTDGTAGGTQLLLELVPGPVSSFPDGLFNATAVLGDQLVFRAMDGTGVEPWVTDGTFGGTRRLADIQPGYGATLGHFDLGDAVLADDGRLFFSAMHPVHGSELWVSDGTPVGTRMLDVRPGVAPSLAVPLVAFGDGVLFSALDTEGLRQLWVTDGTMDGTMQLTTVTGGHGLNPSDAVHVSGRVVMRASTVADGAELWVSDGTQAGTSIVDLRPGSDSSGPADLEVHDGLVYFSADDGVDGREPWTTDGTPGGTSQLLDLYPGANGSHASSFASFDGFVYFGANDGANGPELWRTKGTPATTQMTDDLIPGAAGAAPTSLTASGSQLYFSAHSGGDGRELWSTDGTVGGAAQVADINPGGSDSGPAQLTAYDGGILFTADVAGIGRELWTADTGGASLVIDLVGGAGDPGISELVAGDGYAWFSAIDEVSGDRRLFRTDGTSEGTVVSGLPGVNPNHLVPGSLWYSAYDEDTGRGELYLASDPTSGVADQLTSVPVLDRLEGPDRFGTAVAVSQDVHESADTVVIARGDEYADALAGGPLAHHLDAPILLVRTGSLPEVTATEIDRLGATKAVVLGGPGAVSEDVVQAILDDTSVTSFDRVAGDDRFATAVEVADELPGSTSAFVVEGINADPRRGWPDAVAVSSLASFTGQPILLTRADRLPDATAQLGELGIDRVTIVGGTAAVSEDVADALADAGASLAPRLSGPTRFETSLAVAAASVDAGLWEGRTWSATGLAFPDALVAGPAAASRSAVLLLVHGQTMAAEDPSAGWFTDAAPLERAVLLGGEAAITGSVETLITSLLEG